MGDTLYIHPKVEKNLKQMKALDNAPKIAAHRAEAIIDALKNGVFTAPAGLLSTARDARIKGLFKYDLGQGFRLISLKEKSAVYLLFLGSHDRCDTWLDTYSKKKPHHTAVPMACYNIIPSKSRQTGSAPRFLPDSEESRSDRMPPVSQKVLREVFSGLVESVQARHNGHISEGAC